MIRKVSTALAMLIIISLSTACTALPLADTASGGTNTPETSILATTEVGLAPAGIVPASSSIIEDLVAHD